MVQVPGTIVLGVLENREVQGCQEIGKISAPGPAPDVLTTSGAKANVTIDRAYSEIQVAYVALAPHLPAAEGSKIKVGGGKLNRSFDLFHPAKCRPEINHG
jgi:hypothetical protein